MAKRQLTGLEAKKESDIVQPLLVAIFRVRSGALGPACGRPSANLCIGRLSEGK